MAKRRPKSFQLKSIKSKSLRSRVVKSLATTTPGGKGRIKNRPSYRRVIKR